ncbi:EAL domain-containing protein [Roseateles violae]|uniref:cyclic-guanylate-specific phosphodiesterase n=1 Tax=Roseateles violae TaxID=3058042 RepID=A0ABT8DQJ8_9BURK|nr:EAL domain-containing protein [Pelomonas sp. PFR6]MDN3919363.1 EAL domain-containing protein [Pelomonas sp. PFR6]
MRRRIRIVALGIMLAIGSTLLARLVLLYASWQIALQGEMEVLTQTAGHLLRRASRSVEASEAALREIDVAGFTPCSSEHIARMRLLTMNVRTIEEIGYFDAQGLLRCTSWWPTDRRIARTPVDFERADGIGVKVTARPRVSGGNSMMELRWGHHNALFDPERLVDLIVGRRDLSLVVANEQGRVIQASKEAAPALLSGIPQRPERGIDGDLMYAVARGDGWIALVGASRAAAVERLRAQQALLLPVGAALAIGMSWLAVWLSRRQLSELAQLRRAVQARAFVVEYQPLIDLASRCCVGAEALVRWRRSDGSLTRPDLFIPLAEEHGLIQAITDQVMAAVVAELGELLRSDPNVHIAINLGADDIRSGRFLPVLDRLLQDSGIAPQQVWLEATERGFVDVSSASSVIEQARRRGHKVAIDDFGTGFSSLQYLQGLPLDALKIDKSFVDVLGRETVTSSVVPHIISMAKTLGLAIIAEGVETQAQLDYLRAQGVDGGQGWLFAKAMPAPQFIAYLRRG